MPKLIQKLSKRRIQQIVRNEIYKARVGIESSHDIRDNAPLPSTSSSNNMDNSVIAPSDSFDDGESDSNTQLIVEDLLLEQDYDFQNNDTHFENDAGSAENFDDIHTFEYIQLYENSETSPADNLKNDLRVWLSENSISQRAANNLIAIFRNHGHQELKKDVRTLMKTPRHATGKIIRGNGGAYIHMGITDALMRSVNKYFDDIPETISIQVNCDGMSFSRSSSSQFWPLLGAIETTFYTEPFVIGLFHGNSKPNDFNIFIAPFVTHMYEIQRNGIIIDGKRINIRLSAIICDAPARAYLTMTKSHSGYFGCSKCIQEGDYDGYVTFPEINCQLRTDESFRNMDQEEHHLGESRLTDLDFGMVSQIPIDYQHLVCLGVTKRLLERWCNGPRGERLLDDKLNAIDEGLREVKACIPTEFARQPRLLDCVSKWKATEFRQFLLYSGPIILRDVLSSRKYNHFMALSVSIRILCDPEKCLVLNDYANDLLRWFVTEYINLYGTRAISYNVHHLVHLANDVKNFGPLDNFSTFKFENYMSHLKSKIKNAPKPLEQVINRLHEEDLLPISKKTVQSYPIVKKSLETDEILSLQFNGFTLSKKESENCCILSDDNILIIDSIERNDGKVEIKGKYISELNSLFLEPCDSKDLNIYCIKNNYSSRSVTIDSDLIKSKCTYVSCPTRNESIIIPLLQYNN